MREGGTLAYSYVYVKKWWQKTVPLVTGLSIDQVVAEESDNISVESYFKDDWYKKSMI